MNSTVLDVNSGNVTFDPPGGWQNTTRDGVVVGRYGLRDQLFASLGLTLDGRRDTDSYNSTVEYIFQGEGGNCIRMASADIPQGTL
jgi:hypothetical protein